MTTALSSVVAAELQARLGVPIWTRRDGSQIALPDMDDKHLDFAEAILRPWRQNV